MGKRKRRNKIDKSKIDFMKPVDITIFGSSDDPCFGKLYSPSARECGNCGDSEICAIVCAQKSKVMRGKIEEKNAFKDLEEVDIEVEKVINNIVITNRIKDWKEVLMQVKKKFKYPDLLETAKVVRKILKSSKKLKLKKKNGKRYIRIIKA